jgi:cobyrinic acid a,c-diamide synthase
LLRTALAPLGIPVLGALPQAADLVLPSRHLGLIQARETTDLATILTRAGEFVARHLDLAALIALARSPVLAQPVERPLIPPLGQRIAVARDDAFAFAYPALLEGWRRAGSELSVFSPLADQAPDPAADAVYLPGGYPELQAGKLAANANFLGGLRRAALAGAVIYGECGGYMVMGDGLTDADGTVHQMAGLLRLSTSFAARKLHLGYRQLRTLGDESLFGPPDSPYRGHEFHYASIVSEQGEPLFAASDAAGLALGPMGLRSGRIMGSFVHLLAKVG